MDSRLIGGKYEVTRKIGEGGIACIFLAFDKSNKRSVALKIPKENHNKIYESLKNEYLFAYTHPHPSLLKPYDIIFESQKPILVTPFLEGIALDEFTNSLKKKSKRDSFISIMKRIMATILEAADFIHFSGYCYNDFKPSNILAYDVDGNKGVPEIALIDFNLIIPISDRPGRRGTLHYLAPEVLHGRPSSPASDIYSNGVLFYQLLTGVLPFESESDSELIEHITETGRVDMNAIAGCFRQGISSMLLRDPRKRPADARLAAEALGIADYFDELKKSRTEYYLASGAPPFYKELKKGFDTFRRSDPKKLFLINGYSYNGSSIDFLESKFRVEGTNCVRICRMDNVNGINEILDDIISIKKSEKGETILFIEDLEQLNNENSMKLIELINTRHNIYVAAAAGRWYRPFIKHEVFDPIKYWSLTRCTEACLQAFLKSDELEFEYIDICNSTGGDPEQIYHCLKYIGERNGLNLREAADDADIFSVTTAIPENEHIYRRMLDSLEPEQLELISALSAWGISIPLLMLVKFDRGKHEILEGLTRKGYLVRHKDSVSFFSGGLREYIYRKIPGSKRHDYHKFWAICAEELISDSGECLELTAHHWGLSGDMERGYRYARTAANEFYKIGDYYRARKFAEILLRPGPKDRAGRISALKINGQIYAAIGYFKTARKMYLEVLSKECDKRAKTEIKKNLGKLYISSGHFKKSLYYLKDSLEYFSKTDDEKNLSECHHLIFTILWQQKKYSESLEYLVRSLNNSGNVEKLTRINKAVDENEFMNKALEISKKLKNFSLMVRSYIGLGQDGVKTGEFDKALSQFKKALEISEKACSNNDIIESLINLGSCHLASGDLFMAIECFQNARQAAESFGNIYMKTLAELKLTDVSIMMGNYSLADEVLTAIEQDDIYNEDRLLRLKIDLKRARLYAALGDCETSLSLVMQISESAGIMEEHGLALQASLLAAEPQSEISGTDNIEKLKVFFSKAKKNDLADLVTETQLSLGKYYLYHDNFYNALHYFEDIREAKGSPGGIKLEAAICIAEISAIQNRYERAIENLIETESIAAASGFIPLAHQAANLLGALHKSRGRFDLFEECNYRAKNYLDKLLSALPKGYSSEKYRRKLILTKYTGPGDEKARAKDLNKEPSTAEVG
jgi:serine/threonine protein kinase